MLAVRVPTAIRDFHLYEAFVEIRFSCNAGRISDSRPRRQALHTRFILLSCRKCAPQDPNFGLGLIFKPPFQGLYISSIETKRILAQYSPPSMQYLKPSILVLLSLFTSVLSISNATLDGSLSQCIPQQGPHQIPTAEYTDCIGLILEFVLGSQPDKPMTFSYFTSDGVKLPRKGISGNCVFILDMYNKAMVDTASRRDVGKVATSLAKQCVLNGPKTGGVALAGRDNDIEITLHNLTIARSTNVMAGWEHLGCGSDVVVNTNLAASMAGQTQLALEDCAEGCSGYQYLGTRFGTQ